MQQTLDRSPSENNARRFGVRIMSPPFRKEAAMRRAGRVHAAGVLAFAVCLLAGGAARAQNDLSGEWANLLHEDVNHRNDAIGGGPPGGGHTGPPVNDGAPPRGA